MSVEIETGGNSIPSYYNEQIQQWGCPSCGCAQGYQMISCGNSAQFKCAECGTNFIIVADGESGGEIKAVNQESTKCKKHPREGTPKHNLSS